MGDKPSEDNDIITSVVDKCFGADRLKITTRDEYLSMRYRTHKCGGDDVTFEGDTIVFEYTQNIRQFLFDVIELYTGSAAFDVVFDSWNIPFPHFKKADGFHIFHAFDCVSNIRVSGATPGSTVRLVSRGKDDLFLSSVTADGNCFMPIRLYPGLCQFSELALKAEGPHICVRFSTCCFGALSQSELDLDGPVDVVQTVDGRIHRHRYAGGCLGIWPTEPAPL